MLGSFLYGLHTLYTFFNFLTKKENISFLETSQNEISVVGIRMLTWMSGKTRKYYGKW